MDWRSRIAEDYLRFASGLPCPLEDYILDTYHLSLASEYARLPIKNPFGKASGQLSLNANQVARDAEAGLGFVVLKTLIAQDELGGQSMKAWAIPATKMTVEEIIGTRSGVRGERGWTVTWKGRGWSDTFEAYLTFFGESLEIGSPSTMLVVPSVKYHLPKPGESEWRVKEYEYTTSRLFDVWRNHHGGKLPMPIEKDFSPTLAGDQSFSSQRETILRWLHAVPRIVHETSHGTEIRLGMKLFNASQNRGDEIDDFQVEMLATCEAAHGLSRADFLIYGNRLFDPNKSYESTTGVAYGGPDLSDRNLSVLSKSHLTAPLSATGNIITGKIAFEYLRRGATTFQMHTLFQLPDSEFDMRGTSPQMRTRTARAMHRLLFHPQDGFLTALSEAKEKWNWPDELSIPGIAKILSRPS
ncbi:MAG: hypothetical protein Q8922_06105 [Bacteroidota bacterium]|nr:hypothetical protein [Bacteroidota bacterium]MDP4234124.1 hypothetical protein [Bacteroidota bacterium]MDP4243065.1 hypothetical protein [Bacteroidota bacterium]MDP4287491.1 hypothetical protein [Bacteroidota bacterium]